MLTDLPLKMNDEVRDATRNCGNLTSRFRISSAMPSLKYSFSALPLMLTNGSTAIDLRPSSTGRGLAAAGAAVVAFVPFVAGARSASGADRAGGVRCTPPGPMSKAQASITAIRKPRPTSTVTRVTDQSGMLRFGSTVEATSITTQPLIA